MNVYGSRDVTHEAFKIGLIENGSDIDLTLYGSKDLTLNILSKMLREIDDLLLPYTIDLSIFHNLSDPDFIEHIQRVGMVFYQREPRKVLCSQTEFGSKPNT